jgi:hypothetical protein
MTLVIQCVECGSSTKSFEEGGRAYLTDDEYEPTKAVVFCPGCAEREFGLLRRRAHDEA